MKLVNGENFEDTVTKGNNFQNSSVIVVIVDINLGGLRTFSRFFCEKENSAWWNISFFEKSLFNQLLFYFTFDPVSFPDLEGLTIDPGVIVEPLYMNIEEVAYMKGKPGEDLDAEITNAPLWLLEQMQLKSIRFEKNAY